jgi:type II secretory pathway pseudopilin PulG
MKRGDRRTRDERRLPRQRAQAGLPAVASAQSGYALLLVLFLAALTIIATAAAVPSLLTESRRQKEAELIWRGKQYERAIGLYYRKTGHFPASMADLVKGANGIHFLRQAYKDPMNKEDGSWRLIYLGPNGQLTGSTRFHTLAEYQAAELGPAAGALAALTGAAPAAATGSLFPASNAQPQQGVQPSPLSPSTPIFTQSNPLMGGALVGVGSKVKAPSLKVYLGASKYNEWDFIWSPVQVTPAGTTLPGALPGQPGATGQPAPGQPGFGQFGAGGPGIMPPPSSGAPPSSPTPPQP